MCFRFQLLDPVALEEERRKVSLPLDEHLALHSALEGRRRKPRPRKVDAIYAVDLQAALLRHF